MTPPQLQKIQEQISQIEEYSVSASGEIQIRINGNLEITGIMFKNISTVDEKSTEDLKATINVAIRKASEKIKDLMISLHAQQVTN